MVQFLEDMLKNREKALSSDERNLLSIAYKNSVSSRRTAIRTIVAYETKEKKKETSTFLPFIQEYRKKVEDELTKQCKNIVAMIDSTIKMKGDYNRYMAEYAEGDFKKQVGDDALTAYKEASEKSKTLPVLNPIALGLALNFSVFYYEVMNDHDTAIKVAEESYEKANKEMPNIDEDADENRDAVSIVNLLKENIWICGRVKLKKIKFIILKNFLKTFINLDYV